MFRVIRKYVTLRCRHLSEQWQRLRRQIPATASSGGNQRSETAFSVSVLGQRPGAEARDSDGGMVTYGSFTEGRSRWAADVKAQKAIYTFDVTQN
jgi:hypothetical protein